MQFSGGYYLCRNLEIQNPDLAKPVFKERKQSCLIVMERGIHRVLQNCPKHILQQKKCGGRK